MKALIVDDEAKAREMLHFMLDYYIPEITQLEMASSADEATEMVKQLRPELIFLDVKMPGKDGFTWLRELKEWPFTVIFITAYDQYAIQAIRFSAFDYLLKPVDGQDLREAIDRYLLQRRDPGRAYDNLIYNATQEDPWKYRLTIATTEGTYYLNPAEIIRCEADGNYTHFYLQNKQHIMASRPIGLFAELLESFNFIRCHKSNLINMEHVMRYSEEGLTMKDQSQVDISRRRKKDVKNKLDQYLRLKG